MPHNLCASVQNEVWVYPDNAPVSSHTAAEKAALYVDDTAELAHGLLARFIVILLSQI